MTNKRNKSILYIILLTTIEIIILYIHFGSYFEEYEKIFSFFSFNKINDLNANRFISNSNYILMNILSFIILEYQNLPVYGIYNFIATSTSLLLINYVIIKHLKHKPDILIPTLIISFLLLSENIVEINNVRISIIFCCIFYIVLINEKHISNKFYIIQIPVIIWGILIRIEIGLILSFIGIFYIFLFSNDKKKIAISFFVLLFSIFINIIFQINLNESKDYKYQTFKYERELIDKQNIKKYNYLTNNKEYIKNEAMQYFVQDYNNIKISDYSNSIEFKNLIEYIFKNKKFIGIYKKKIINIKEDLLANKSYIIIIVLILFFMCFRAENQKIKKIFFMLLIFSIPLVIMIQALMEPRFLHPYIIGAFLLMFSIPNQRIWNRKYLYIFIIALSIFKYDELESISERYKKAHENYLVYSNFINKIYLEGHIPVLANYLYEEINSPKVFHVNNDPEYYVLDYFFYTYYELFIIRSKKIFKDNTNFYKKLKDIEKNEKLILISNYKYNNFMENYLREFYHSKIIFKPMYIDNQMNLIAEKLIIENHE